MLTSFTTFDSYLNVNNPSYEIRSGRFSPALRTRGLFLRPLPVPAPLSDVFWSSHRASASVFSVCASGATAAA